jgi:hypothetical protein
VAEPAAGRGPPELVTCLAAAGCSSSVHVVAIDDAAYKKTWEANWQLIIRDSMPWRPRGSSPGVCNRGGNREGCMETDQKVAADLQRLLDDLGRTSVPSEFSAATTTLKEAVSLDIQGLKHRDAAITRNDDALFALAVDELGRANSLFKKGYSQFPNYDRPAPQPFGGPGGYSG